MINLCNKDNWSWKKTFYLLLLRINPRTSSLTALCITLCSNLSFCLVLLNCLYLSAFLFSNIRYVLSQLYCPFSVIVRILSVFLVILSCFSVFFQLVCHLSYFSFMEHVCSPMLTLFYCFFGLCFVKWVSAFNFELINNEQIWMLNLYNSDN